MIVKQPAPGDDFEVRLKGITFARKISHNVISRLRVGRMIFQSYKVRARSGFTTTFVVTDHSTRGYIADAKAVLCGIVQWIDKCEIEDEYKWKTEFRNEMDRLHEDRSKKDRGREDRSKKDWGRRWWRRQGWNRVHYPLPGYREVRRRYLKGDKHADTFFENWAWEEYSSDNLATKFRGIIKELSVLSRPTSGQTASAVPKLGTARCIAAGSPPRSM